MLAERIAPVQLADLAAAGACLDERGTARQWPRLREVVIPEGRDGETPLEVSVGFSRGADGLVLLRIEAAGRLALRCQRCLGAMPWPVAVAATLTVVPDETRAGDLVDPFDSVLLEADGSLALRDAVEDEILADLPLAPLHDDGECQVAGKATGERPVAADTTKPFAGLADLMRRGSGADE